MAFIKNIINKFKTIFNKKQKIFEEDNQNNIVQDDLNQLSNLTDNKDKLFEFILLQVKFEKQFTITYLKFYT